MSRPITCTDSAGRHRTATVGILFRNLTAIGCVVSTELVDARNDNTIWADSYDQDFTDIFAIQSEVAQTIARKLTATLSPEEKKIIEAKPTDDLDAYDLFLRAKPLILSVRLSSGIGTSQSPDNAIGFLEEAVRPAPQVRARLLRTRTSVRSAL
jgi:hypothetical protein